MTLFLSHKSLEVSLLIKKYVIFKDDDVGRDFEKFKRWIDVILDNNAKAAIGLIGKYLKNIIFPTGCTCEIKTDN